MYEIAVEKKFSCAHFLRHYHGKNESLHSHDWKVQIRFRGKHLKKPEQYLVDFSEVQDILREIIKKVENKNMNEVLPFDKINPTAENVAAWIYKMWVEKMPSVFPFSVTVWETEMASASYYPPRSN